MLPHFYHERQRRRKKRLFISGAVSVVTICAAVLLFTLTGSPEKTTKVIKPANEALLSKNAAVEITTLYECGHSKTRQMPLPEDLVGKSRKDVTLLYPQWTLLNFNETFLVAEEKDGAECDDHFLLYLKDNTITVTKSKDKTQIITEQKINLNLLTKEDREILESGMLINSEYELLEILESFQ